MLRERHLRLGERELPARIGGLARFLKRPTSTRAARPFEDADVELVREHAGPGALYDNAAALYL